MKKQLSIIIFIISILFFSCKNQNAHNNDGKKIFRYNESAGITSLDPAFSRNVENIWACNQLYNGLVQMNDNLKINPCIAKSWEISEDGKTYTFHLRTDVKFHNHPLFKDSIGRKVVAQDFVYSFNRIIDSRVASPGAWIFNNIAFLEEHHFKAFEAINDSTLKIYLSKPFPPFLSILTMQYCSVVCSEIVDYYKNDYGNHPVLFNLRCGMKETKWCF